jgi:hypothetical protein
MAFCAHGVRMSLVGKAVRLLPCHPELVSGSIERHARSVAADKWTLKQVQGDDAALVG